LVAQPYQPGNLTFVPGAFAALPLTAAAPILALT